MQIATLRRRASAIATLMRRHSTSPLLDRAWQDSVLPPIGLFLHDLRKGLHEGVVGEHEDYWRKVVNKVLEEIAADQHAVRRLARHETVFAQVKYLCAEVTSFPSEPMVKTHNRYRLVLAFCEAIKVVNHPKL